MWNSTIQTYCAICTTILDDSDRSQVFVAHGPLLFPWITDSEVEFFSVCSASPKSILLLVLSTLMDTFFIHNQCHIAAGVAVAQTKHRCCMIP